MFDINTIYQSGDFALSLQIIVYYCLNAIQIVTGQYLLYRIFKDFVFFKQK